MHTSSLIIATYNWPKALDLCLQSVLNQKVLPGEVIIADDGSGEETRQLIEKHKKNFPIPLFHVWHEDAGFRLSAIRNKAIALSDGDYIIQIDGDLILHPYFIHDHLEARRAHHFVAGSRVMLNPSTTENLLEHRSIDIKKFRTKGMSFNDMRNKALRRWLAERYKTSGRFTYYVKGCNMAFYKSDLIMVNGYNEAFQGWGSEDREIAIRLINAGVRKRSLKMGALCYHLYHKIPSRDKAKENEALMYHAIHQKMVVASVGLNQYF